MPPILRRLRAHAVAVAVALAVTSLTGACSGAQSDTPSEADCERMRAHVIDLQLRGEAKPGDKHRAAELAKHRRIRVAANRTADLARCQSDMSDDDIACALAASSLEQYRACGQK